MPVEAQVAGKQQPTPTVSPYHNYPLRSEKFTWKRWSTCRRQLSGSEDMYMEGRSWTHVLRVHEISQTARAGLHSYFLVRCSCVARLSLWSVENARCCNPASPVTWRHIVATSVGTCAVRITEASEAERSRCSCEFCFFSLQWYLCTQDAEQLFVAIHDVYMPIHTQTWEHVVDHSME